MKIRLWDLNLKIRLIGETIFNTFFWMYFPFLTLYFSDKFGKNMAGILMSFPPLVGIIGSLLGGYLSDRLGRRSTMLIGAFIQVVMFALFAMSLLDWIDYLAYIGISFGGAIYYPASSAMVADLTLEKDRRNVFATFVTANNIGAVFGPMIGSILFFQYKSALLWTCTIVTFIYSIAIYFMIRETIPDVAQTRNQFNEPKQSNERKQSNKLFFILKEQWQNYSIILHDKVFALFILAGVFVTIAFKQLNLYLAVYVKEHVPLQTMISWNDWTIDLNSMQVFGWIMGLNGLMFVLLVIPITKWFENWSDRNSLIFSAFLFGLGMFLVGFTTNIWLLLVFTLIFTVGEIMNAPVASSFISKYAPEEARGQYMGASNLQFTIGRFIAPITIILSNWLSSLGVFGFIFICTILSGIIYLKLFKMMPIKAQIKGEEVTTL